MSIASPILLYGAGKEALSTRAFLRETQPDAQVDVVVDLGTPDIADTNIVSIDEVSELVKSGHYKTIIRSPGVSIYKPIFKLAAEANVTVTTNVNLWSDYRRGTSTVVAITGTKGKSTTTKLIYTILKAAGLDVGLAGNIGVPLLDADQHKYMVLELSSFQCADLTLDPDFIGITSLYPEHLDWHEGSANYFKDKLNILRRKRPYKISLTPQVRSQSTLPQPRPHLVNRLPELPDEFITDFKLALDSSTLVGAHNFENARLAARIALGVGVSNQAVLDGVAAFIPLRHRLQQEVFGGKNFINDSIATNQQATNAAINAYPGDDTHLIVGGFDREQDYGDLSAFLMGSNLKKVWFLPDTGWRIADGFDGKDTPFEIHKAQSLDEIFKNLTDAPKQFDRLILSPGAPSYNQFKNFEERGDRFLELAEKHFGQTP